MNTLDATAAVDLVTRIADGETRAESELVERCGGAVRFLARRFTRNESDAEDLYQETFVLALEKIRNREIREPERLAGFLRALAKNLSIRRYRRLGYTAETPILSSIPEAADDAEPDPLKGLVQRERVRTTRRLLGELDQPRDRALLFRYYIAEEPSARICTDLDLDTDHFYRVLYRARKRYRKLWEERSPPQDSP